jgi:hypothetical protein
MRSQSYIRIEVGDGRPGFLILPSIAIAEWVGVADGNAVRGP